MVDDKVVKNDSTNLKVNKVQKLQSKIESLKLEQIQLRAREALLLYKKLETMLGTSFSPELVIGMIHQFSQMTTPADHIKLVEQGAAFFRQGRAAKSKTTQNGQTKNDSTQ